MGLASGTCPASGKEQLHPFLLSPSPAHFCWGAWLVIFFFFNKSASSRSAPALQQQDCTGGFPSALGNEPASGCREPTKSHLTRNFLFYKIKVAPWNAAGGTETQVGLTQREIILEVKLEGFFWKADGSAVTKVLVLLFNNR